MGNVARDFERAFRRTDPTWPMVESGLTPDDWQANWLRSNAARQALCCSRQAGKTESAASLAIHIAVQEPGSLVLFVAPAQRQSKESFRAVPRMYSKLENVPEIVQDSVLGLQLRNDSRILALPGSERTIRGLSGVKAVILDEAARIEDELIMALRPMMATVDGARFIALSTPYGRRGWFFEQWERGIGWERTKIAADQCPRIRKEFLDEERQLLGDWQFRQEYMCEFVDTDEQFFSSALIEACVTDKVKAWKL